jgi:hypothetical protein
MVLPLGFKDVCVHRHKLKFTTNKCTEMATSVMVEFLSCYVSYCLDCIAELAFQTTSPRGPDCVAVSWWHSSAPEIRPASSRTAGVTHGDTTRENSPPYLDQAKVVADPILMIPRAFQKIFDRNENNPASQPPMSTRAESYRTSPVMILKLVFRET